MFCVGGALSLSLSLFFNVCPSNEMLSAASAALPAGFCPVQSVSCQRRKKATVRRGGGGADGGMREEEGRTERRRAGLSWC